MTLVWLQRVAVPASQVGVVTLVSYLKQLLLVVFSSIEGGDRHPHVAKFEHPFESGLDS